MINKSVILLIVLSKRKLADMNLEKYTRMFLAFCLYIYKMEKF